MNNATLTTPAAIPAPVCRMMRRITEIRIRIGAKLSRLQEDLAKLTKANEGEAMEADAVSAWYHVESDRKTVAFWYGMAKEAESFAEEKATDAKSVRLATRAALRSYHAALAA